MYLIYMAQYSYMKALEDSTNIILQLTSAYCVTSVSGSEIALIHTLVNLK
jgi:hypothetical protein